MKTEIETLRLMTFRNGEKVDFLDNRLEEIEALDEAKKKALQKNLQGNLLDTKTNGSRVKPYHPQKNAG